MRRDIDKSRVWQQRSRKPIPQVSARKLASRGDRAAVRAVVLLRANYQCEYASVIPEVPCRFYAWAGRGRLEVDELRGGSRRSTEELDAASCVATCPAHHDFKTNNKREVLRRLEER